MAKSCYFVNVNILTNARTRTHTRALAQRPLLYKPGVLSTETRLITIHTGHNPVLLEDCCTNSVPTETQFVKQTQRMCAIYHAYLFKNKINTFHTIADGNMIKKKSIKRTLV